MFIANLHRKALPNWVNNIHVNHTWIRVQDMKNRFNNIMHRFGWNATGRSRHARFVRQKRGKKMAPCA
jgi:hypothetical protein